jgi:hypothetical protein
MKKVKNILKLIFLAEGKKKREGGGERVAKRGPRHTQT